MSPHGRTGVVHATNADGNWNENGAERKELSSDKQYSIQSIKPIFAANSLPKRCMESKRHVVGMTAWLVAF
jgi:hypothetical protein